MNWYIEVLKKYAEFNGRARRMEYWYFFLFNFLIMVGLIMIGGAMGSSSGGILYNLYSLAVLIPGIAVGIRRLHDTNRSGWFLLIGFIPVIGWLILIYFFAQDGDASENQYGPNPKLVTA
jgi:uncharacterized membrane protein YhaH (DUF805 family)